MRILLITPQGPSSRTGNRVAANRWASILRQLGHRVDVCEAYSDQDCDAMVAIHAWRSAGSIGRFRQRHAERPLLLQLSGTDIYQYLDEDPGPTLQSMRLADRLVALNGLAWRVVPREMRHKLVTVYQSAKAPSRPRRPSVRTVDICVIGHLREVKDPLRAAEAARLLPPESRVRILQAGAAYSSDWSARVEAEMADNPRYVWRGDISGGAVRRLLLSSHAMVLSSLSEGGANVISEAAVCGLPILASRMEGNVGLLGHKYPGYFPVSDTVALTRLLLRIENDPPFVTRLRRAVRSRAKLFAPSRERSAWRHLLRDLSQRAGARKKS